MSVQTRAKYEGAMRELLLMTENNGKFKAHCGPAYMLCSHILTVDVLECTVKCFDTDAKGVGNKPTENPGSSQNLNPRPIEYIPLPVGNNFGNNAVAFPTIGKSKWVV